MGIRVQFATKIDSDAKDKLKLLSDLTRIQQTKYIDEALEDLFKKYEHIIEKKPQ